MTQIKINRYRSVTIDPNDCVDAEYMEMRTVRGRTFTLRDGQMVEEITDKINSGEIQVVILTQLNFS